MSIIANILVGLVAVLHIYFLILEMFLWDRPLGLRVFGNTQESAKASKILAMNQGLYNGFLAAGLLWGLSLGAAGDSIKLFFLACVVVAGVFGGLTASRKILFVQALPAAVAFALMLVPCMSNATNSLVQANDTSSAWSRASSYATGDTLYIAARAVNGSTMGELSNTVMIYLTP